MVHKSNSPPDLDKYIKGKLHNFVTYEDGARLYSIPYWSFVNSVKEAGANRMIRQRVLVDQDIYEKFIEDNCRYEETVKENKEMPKRRNTMVSVRAVARRTIFWMTSSFRYSP